MKNNALFDPETFRIIDTRRLAYFVVFLWSFGITEIGRIAYRPYIYSHNINDFGLADAIGNLGGIVVQIFFMLAIINPPPKKAWIYIIFLPFGYVVYEILQPILPRGVYDIKDVWASFIGGLIAALLYLLIQNHFNNRFIYKFK